MRIIYCFVFILFTVTARSQSIIDSLSSLSFTLTDTISDKLADLAIKNHPSLEVYEKRAEADLWEWKRSKMSFLNNVGASFNLNEGNLRSNSDSSLPNLFYPRYNFNLSLPLSTFFGRPKETKRAKATYEGSVAMKQSEALSLRASVKRAYQIYITHRYILRIQESAMQDEKVLYDQLQDKFEKNQITLDQFTNAAKRHNDELVRRLNLMRDANLAKIDLENLLGMRLEEALIAIQQPQ